VPSRTDLRGANKVPAMTEPAPDAPHLSPLDAEHRALGAKLVPFGGWDMPLAYPTGTIDEHLACRTVPWCST
jgi:hypothetical protein